MFRREQKATHTLRRAKNFMIGRKCSPSDKMMLLKGKKNIGGLWSICRYCVIVKNLRMDMPDSGNVEIKVSHPLQCVLMKNTAEKCKCS